MPSATSPELRNPWSAFLVDVDGQLSARLRSAVAAATNDLDYIEIIPHDAQATMQEIAGVESPLARKYRVHFQHVGVASLRGLVRGPLGGALSGRFRRLRLFALDPYDRALSKLTRYSMHSHGRSPTASSTRCSSLRCCESRRVIRDRSRLNIIPEAVPRQREDLPAS